MKNLGIPDGRTKPALYFRFLDIVNLIGLILGGVLLCVMSLAVFGSVISRYIPNFSLTWVEELVTYGMAWLCTVGGGLATRKGDMTRVTLFLNLFPDRIKKVMELFAFAASIIIFILIIRSGYQMALVGLNRKSTAMPVVTMFWLYIAMPAGVTIMLLNTLGRIALLFKPELEGGKRKC